MRRPAEVISVALLCLCATAAPRVADADPGKIKKLSLEAMENFDLLEFDEAKKLLLDAVKLAKKTKLRDPLVASVYVRLGVVYFSGYEDVENAKLQFISAIEIDPTASIDPAYSTKSMSKLLDEVKKEYGTAATGDGDGDVDVDLGDGDGDGDGDSATADENCDAVEGLVHELVLEANAGAPVALVAKAGVDLKADSLSIFFRSKGAANFEEVKMKRSGDCGFAGEIPASALGGDVVHYYIQANSSGGKKVGNRGSSGSPNIIEVKPSLGAGLGAIDEENPLGPSSSSEQKEKPDTNIKKKNIGPIGGASAPKLFLSVAAGSGGGYVSGETEQVKSPVGCCVAPALLHGFVELGYYLSEQLAIGGAFRIGFPIGANRQGHAGAAAAGMLRVHYALSPGGGDGISVSGAVGAGLIRHTVKIDDQPDNMNVDTTASGPLVLGAGAYYQRALSGPMKFVLELNALSALGGMAIGGVEPGFALQVDANLGIRFAF